MKIIEISPSKKFMATTKTCAWNDFLQQRNNILYVIGGNDYNLH
jgi:hypothetical protein